MSDLDYLDRYIWEAEAHANELLEIYDHAERHEMAELFDEEWQTFGEGVLRPRPDALHQALIFLGEGPTARDRRLKKLDPVQARLLWLRARVLELRSATALHQAASVADVRGMKYRQAVRHVATAISPAPDPLTAWEIALHQYNA